MSLSEATSMLALLEFIFFAYLVSVANAISTDSYYFVSIIGGSNVLVFSNVSRVYYMHLDVKSLLYSAYYFLFY